MSDGPTKFSEDEMQGFRAVPKITYGEKQAVDNIQVVLKERGSKYGDFKIHAKITQDLKRVFEKYEYSKKLSDTQKEALDMIAHKIGRILNGNPNYIDSWVDIVGYAQLVVNELKNDIF